nr:unnamed protein product [Callosobruchus chinensis]
MLNKKNNKRKKKIVSASVASSPFPTANPTKKDESSSSDTSSSSSSSSSSTASEHIERQQQPRQYPIENCLGVDPTQINTLGPEISENIAVRWNSYLSTGLDRETNKIDGKIQNPTELQNCGWA